MVYNYQNLDSNFMNNNIMHSSRNNKKLWWSRLKSPSFLSKSGKTLRKDENEGEIVDGLTRKLNVNEEYKEVFRTKSYTEIWSKVQVQLKGSLTALDHRLSFSSTPCNNEHHHPSTSNPSPLPRYLHLTDCLLEPRQEAVNDIVKSSKLRNLLIHYFEASLEAGNICELLLGGLHKTRSNHRIIKRVIKLSRGGANEQFQDMIICELDTFARLRNPLLGLHGAVDFTKVHEKYATLLKELTSRRRKIKRREKFTRLYKKAAGYGFMITYALLAIAMIALAMHSVVGMLGLPGLVVTFPYEVMKKTKGGGPKASFLQRLASQLDVAARGVYILINDFDTVGRLVGRLRDEVEHTRALAEICVRNRKSHEVVKEALRELQIHEDGFVEQLNELEEHIYLCFLTINRSRRLVIQEILSP